MAESKRAEAEEKYELPVPPFDADAYVRRETIGARASVVLAIYGLLLGQLGGIVAFVMHNNNVMVVGLAVFFFGLVGLQGLLEAAGVPTKEWDRKTWLGHGGLLFFAWLASLILFQNAPFLFRPTGAAGF